MNPVALQHAKGNPFAPTSWGAFGPSWLVVTTEAAGDPVTIDTTTAIVELRAAVTSVDVTGQTIDTQAARVELRAGITSVTVTSPDGIAFYSCDVFAPTVTCEVL